MKTLSIIMVVAVSCGAAVADAETATNAVPAEARAAARPKLTPEERKARIQQSLMRRHGGIVRDTRDMAGAFKVINAQSAVGVGALAGYLEEVSDSSLFDIRLECVAPGSVNLGNIDAELARSKADVAVFVVEADGLPGLLVAPESRWAMVNVRAYAGELQQLRVGRELARAVAYVGGAACDGYGTSLMGAITEPQQLDNFKSSRLNFETAGRMATYLRELGVRPFSKITYRETCRLGFAARPTNEWQRAIWNEYYQLPTKPLRIEFDPKKGK